MIQCLNIFSQYLAVVDVYVRAKSHQANCSSLQFFCVNRNKNKQRNEPSNDAKNNTADSNDINQSSSLLTSLSSVTSQEISPLASTRVGTGRRHVLCSKAAAQFDSTSSVATSAAAAAVVVVTSQSRASLQPQSSALSSVKMAVSRTSEIPLLATSSEEQSLERCRR